MDEFSDFQMAVQLPPPSVVTMSIPPPLFTNTRVMPPIATGKMLLSSGVRFSSDNSPVHSIASHNTKSDLVHTQANSSQSLVPPTNKCGAGVGSRLANYDLGLSGPVTQPNGFQNNSEFLSTTSFANFSKTINTLSNHHTQPTPLPIQRNGQDLLIGEEDKYSALRMLIETDMNTTSLSVFEKPAVDATESSTTQNQVKPETLNSIPVQSNCNDICNDHSLTPMNSPASSTAVDLNNLNSKPPFNSSVVNSNNLIGALKFSKGASQTVNPFSLSTETSTITGGDSSDFGDFQSFTGFVSASTIPSHILPNSAISLLSTTDNFTANFQSPSTKASVELPNLTSSHSQKTLSFDFLPHSTTEPSLQNGTCDSDDGDTEFGDFVSVEPAVQEVLQNQNNLPPVPAPLPLPLISSWNKHLDLSPLTLIEQTPPPLPSALQEDKENIGDMMDIGGYFSKFSSSDSDIRQTTAKHEQELCLAPPSQQIGDVDDDFETFSTFTSAPNYSVVQANNSDQEKIVDCSALKTPPLSTTFIRTSLIRNDKVTDIDSLKWNQSVEEGQIENSMLDYSSCDRKDLPSTGGGKSKFLDVSPETRSIASLDLGNYVTVDYSDAAIVNNNNHSSNNNTLFSHVVPLQNNHQPMNGLKPAMSIPGTLPLKGIVPVEEPAIYDEYDKYQCFREECENENERYYVEWHRCLITCKELISKAYAVFNGVSTSEVIREVVADEKGYSYVINILEIYRLSQRIQKSAARLGIQPKLSGVSVEITNLWETLVAFLLGSCVSAEIYQDSVEHGDCCGDDSHPSCGVCLCSVNTSESSQFLDYGGKLYHCKCANFWVNEVDAILPSLSNVSNIVGSSSSSISSSSNSNGAGTTASSLQGSGSILSKFEKANSLV